MEIQDNDDTDCFPISHSFLEDVMKVLDTGLTPHHLICNAENHRVHVFSERKEWHLLPLHHCH